MHVQGSKPGKVATPGAFVDAASAAWQQAAVDGQPSETWLRERYLGARAYESAYGAAQATLRKWMPQIAKGKMVKGFGVAAAAILSDALSTFDAGVSSCSVASAPMLAQRRARLAKVRATPRAQRGDSNRTCSARAAPS